MLEVIPRTGGGDVGDQRVGTHRESTDGGGVQGMLADQVIEDQTGKASTFCMQRSSAAVDVVIAARARGENEIAEAKRALRNQIEKSGLVIGHILCKL